MKRLKTVVILAKNVDGGTGTYIVNLNAIQKKLGVNVAYLILEKPKYRKLRLKNLIFLNKAGFYPNKYSLLTRNLKHFIREMLWLKKNILLLSPSLVISVDLHCNLLILICRSIFKLNTKIITTNHIDLKKTVNAKSSLIVSLLLKKLISYFYKKSEYLVAVSQSLAKSLQSDFGFPQVRTIYNGAKLKLSRARTLNPKRPVIFISVGRLDAQKDFETLVDAFKLTLASLPSSRLWIIGEGSHKPIIKKRIKSLKITKNVFFKGWKGKINAYLKKADVFVLSSKREGFSYVILEAMASGLPIISTDTPYGPSEILGQGRYGKLIPMNNAELLSKAMLEIGTKKIVYKHYSKKSISRVNYFSLDKMLAGYLNLTKKLI